MIADQIRDAHPDDAAAILDIYGPVIENSAISFEMSRPTGEEMQRRIERATDRCPWLVMEGDGRLRGYAYAVPFRSREAYQYTAETTVYVGEQDRGAGVGRRLMEALLARLRGTGHHIAIAGITLPNPASVALHERLGFQPVGVFPEVGRKFDAWHDVGFWSLRLTESSGHPT